MDAFKSSATGPTNPPAHQTTSHLTPKKSTSPIQRKSQGLFITSSNPSSEVLAYDVLESPRPRVPASPSPRVPPLVTAVFEPRTATESEMFPYLTCLFTTTVTLLRIILLIQTSSLCVQGRSLSQHVYFRLPFVAQKRRLLKLSTRGRVNAITSICYPLKTVTGNNNCSCL